MNKLTKKILMIAAMLGIVATTMAAVKVDTHAANTSTIVYVSTADVCYHNDGCKCLKSDKIPVDVNQAAALGFTACTKCKAPAVAGAVTTSKASAATSGQTVWLSATGDKYHNKNNCGKMNPSKAVQVTLEDAKARGKSACKKCFK